MQIQSSLGPVEKCEAKEVGYLSVLRSEVVVAFVDLLVDQAIIATGLVPLSGLSYALGPSDGEMAPAAASISMSFMAAVLICISCQNLVIIF